MVGFSLHCKKKIFNEEDDAWTKCISSLLYKQSTMWQMRAILLEAPGGPGSRNA
jgi:hypothetical protein